MQRGFVVQTQNATAGTRGTDYIVTTMKKNPWVTEVSVLEGIVELCNRLEEKLRVECVELTRLMVAQVLDVSTSETSEIETVPELEKILEGVVWPEEPGAEVPRQS
jgi:ferric-dicitrate binding protein FerR (iron transport regulator)